MKKTICLRLDEDIYNLLQDLKINYFINVSSFVCCAIKEKLEKEKQLAK